jgi:hypothetical protein
MNVLGALRALVLAYRVEEPDEFRVAEQFGLDERAASLFRWPPLVAPGSAEGASLVRPTSRP